MSFVVQNLTAQKSSWQMPSIEDMTKRDMWVTRCSDRVMILILESLNPWNPRNPRNPWNPWNCEFSRVARSYEDIDEWGHVEEASLWPCHDGAPPSYPPPCLSFAYKTIVWLLYYTMQCLSFTSKIILYHTMPIFCIQNPTIQCNACLSHTRPLYGYHIMPYHEMPIFRK